MANKVRIPPQNVRIVGEDGRVATAWYRYFYSEWDVTGGDFNGMESTQNRDLFDSTSHTASLYDFVINFQSTSTALTTSGNQFIVVTGAVTITLNQYPIDGEAVKIKRATTAGAVIVDGNGKNIDGATTYKILQNYEGIAVVYSALDNAWFII
jgi:hypothetical protein